MKRIILVLMICISCILAACGKEESSSANKSEPTSKDGGKANAPSPSVVAESINIVLSKVEGTASVFNKNGDHVSWTDGLHLHNGNRVNTEAYSYAYLALDDAKAAKLDQLSEVEVCKADKNLQLLLSEGEVFFNVSQPLADDESMNIRTSTMVTGIRGTAGYVHVVDYTRSELYILEGTVTVTGYEPGSGELKTVQVTAGQTAVCELFEEREQGSRVTITISSFEGKDVPVYIADEIASDSALQKRIDAAGSGLKVSTILADLESRRANEKDITNAYLVGADTRKDIWQEDDTGITDEMFYNGGIIQNETGTDSGSDGDAEDGGSVGDSSGGTSASGAKKGTGSSPSNNKSNGSTGSGNNNSSDDNENNNNSADSGNNNPPTTVQSRVENLSIDSGNTVNGGEYQDVTIGAGVGNGNVSMKGVSVHGNLTVNGGGSHSVHLDNCTIDGTVIVNKSGGEPVRLVVEGGTSLSSVTAQSEMILDVADTASSVKMVNAEKPVTVQTKDNSIPAITMTADCPDVTVNGESILPSAESFPEVNPDDPFEEHNFKSTVTPATCAQTGWETFVCEDCGYSYIISGITDDVYGNERYLNHEYAEKIIEPSCEDGYTLQTCKDCGFQMKTDFIPGDNHHLVTDDEKKETKCSKCGKDLSEIFEQLLCERGYVDTDEMENDGIIYLNKDLTVSKDQSVFVNTDLVLLGRLTNKGEIRIGENGTFLNHGTLINELGCQFNSDTGEIEEYDRGVLECGGNFINEKDGVFYYGEVWISEDAEFVNDGKILRADPTPLGDDFSPMFYNIGTMINNGSISIGGEFQIFGRFDNNGKITSNGRVLWFGVGGTLNNSNAGDIDVTCNRFIMDTTAAPYSLQASDYEGYSYQLINYGTFTVTFEYYDETSEFSIRRDSVIANYGNMTINSDIGSSGVLYNGTYGDETGHLTVNGKLSVDNLKVDGGEVTVEGLFKNWEKTEIQNGSVVKVRGALENVNSNSLIDVKSGSALKVYGNVDNGTSGQSKINISNTGSVEVQGDVCNSGRITIDEGGSLKIYGVLTGDGNISGEYTCLNAAHALNVPGLDENSGSDSSEPEDDEDAPSPDRETRDPENDALGKGAEKKTGKETEEEEQ